jgi:cobalt-zinc-cadmium efflux system outer membrane protein
MNTAPNCYRLTASAWLLVALIGVAPAGAEAQRDAAAANAPPAGTLDLAAALQIADANSPALQRVDSRTGIALGELRTLGQWPNPTLEYRRENLGAPLQPDEFVTAYVPFDFTGRRITLGRATARGRERLELERSAARRDVHVEIARVWVRALLSAEQGETMRQHYQAVEDIAGIEVQRAREGVVADAVAFRTRVEANRLAHETALAESQAKQDQLALATMLGVPVEQLPPLPRLADPGIVPVVDQMLADTAVSDAVLLAAARQQRTELRAADRAREEATLRQRVETAGVLGDWQLQGGTKKTSGFMSGQVGLAVPLPLFNQNDGARARSVSVRRDADVAWRELQLQIDAEVVAAADQWRRLQRIRGRLLDIPQLGEQIAASARVAYAEGHMSLLELLDAQRAAADARRTAQQYQADLHLARFRLARAIGAALLPGSTP